MILKRFRETCWVAMFWQRRRPALADSYVLEFGNLSQKLFCGRAFHVAPQAHSWKFPRAGAGNPLPEPIRDLPFCLRRRPASVDSCARKYDFSSGNHRSQARKSERGLALAGQNSRAIF